MSIVVIKHISSDTFESEKITYQKLFLENVSISVFFIFRTILIMIIIANTTNAINTLIILGKVPKSVIIAKTIPVIVKIFQHLSFYIIQ